MKLAIVTAVATLALVSMNSEASVNTYTYSNTEYCQLATGDATEMTLAAYSRKLGFTPTQAECRALLQPVKAAVSVSEEDIARQQLLRFQRGSVIRLNRTLEQKLVALPADERMSVLKNLFN
ncbi:hypothetical protein SAMN06297280_1830 [Arsukibacterium tuosuense]|uniref:DUF3718 domain-containing protein n=1 Tax=Arsukibacterium tuosuense TaxID=1323745 RepID=A0A285ITL1_9GAMM|nr:hypothetical protein [Arsukibacterium tuosuense]SNY51375.1 hypothetical protein SAMN06297280_1830 [Arsukibacterium tuosuense]